MTSSSAEQFRTLVETVTDPVRRYLWRRTDEATADDVLAETLLVLWRRLDEVPSDKPTAWAIGVARLQLSNAQRAGRRQMLLAQRIIALDPPSGVAPAGVPHLTDTDDDVRVALGQLRRDEAELLRLWVWEELGPSEIATVLNITANAAAIRLHRAKKKFSAEYGKTPSGAGHIEMRKGDLR